MSFYDAINNPRNFAISINNNPKNDFGVFAKGYSWAARNLAQILLSQNSFANYDAYPVVFLYRHSFELYLKNIIYRAIPLAAFKRFTDIDTRLYNHHKLDILAAIAERILQRLFPVDNSLKEFIKKCVQIAEEYQIIDQDSYSYRYPIGIQGNPSTPKNQIVNLDSLYQTMNEILDGLDAVDFGISAETDMAQDVYEMLNSEGTNP